MKSLDHYWYSQNPVAWFFWPLSQLFCLISFLRRGLYRRGVLKSIAFDVPVVVVGNISVGGSGKTPLLIALCDYLKQQGKKPGVVSRGYGGTVEGVKQLDKSDAVKDVGDEPSMIFQRCACPVVVGRDRAAAVAYLLANNDCDIVLSDDGLQHYKLQRQFEIAVIDAVRKHGNGFCLPAGPLREKISRLKSVDLVVYNGKPQGEVTGENSCFYQLKFEQVINILTGEKKALHSLQNLPVLAIAGIGFPQRFFDCLNAEGLLIQQQPYSDHYDFVESDVKTWAGKCVLMTEKDAVKCRKLLQVNAADSNEYNDVWYLPVTAIMNDNLQNILNTNLLEK